jgi:hypothetical protein
MHWMWRVCERRILLRFMLWCNAWVAQCTLRSSQRRSTPPQHARGHAQMDIPPLMRMNSLSGAARGCGRM